MSVKAEYDKDLNKVSIVLPNDMVDLEPEDIERLVKDLSSLSLKVNKNKREVPKDLFLSGHSKTEYFAQSSSYDKKTKWYGYMGGHELCEENLDEIINWCTEVKCYIDKRRKALKQ